MKPDLSTRMELDEIVRNFYRKAISDDIIGHFFTEVIALNLEVHLPKIVAFWAAILLGESGYQENVMLKHLRLHELSPIDGKHFNRWLSLWSDTIYSSYTGPKADLAVQRATEIALLMQHKINPTEL